MKRENKNLILLFTVFSILTLTLIPSYAATRAFTKYVDSRQCYWQSTGIQVTTGDILTFNASGQVVYWKSADGTQKKYCGPNGSGPGACSGSEPCCLAPGLGDNALVGKIDSGSPFYIGANKTVVANVSGTLYLGMNETVHCGGCADNEGSWTVHITQSYSAPSLSCSPNSLDFGTSSTSKTFSVWNSDGGTLNYTISDNKSWISVSPTSGSSTGEHDTITITVDRSGLAEGHYTGTVTISSNGGRQTVQVTMDVPPPTPTPHLSRSPSSLNFGTSSTSKTFSVWNSDGGTLNYTISDNKSWISVSPTSGSSTGEHDTITITVDRSGLAEGHYTGTVTISSNGGRQTVQVTMDVPPPTPTPHLSRSPSSLDFGTSSTSKTFSVWNSDGGILNYTISDNRSWISVSPTSGSSTGEHDTITVTVNRSGLSTGHHTGTVIIHSSVGLDQSVSLSLTVEEPKPDLDCSTRSLQFGNLSTRKTFRLKNTGGGSVAYSISANADWIQSTSPSSGKLDAAGSDTITVEIERDKLQPGLNSGTLEIVSNAGNCFIVVSAKGAAPDPCATNQAPSIPTPISPTNSETAPFPPELKLEWKCSDPDGDPLTYKVYLYWDYSELSTAYKDPEELAKYLVATTTDTSWAPSHVLIRNAKYYWSVIASDGCSERKSPIFSFRVASRVAPPYNACWNGESTPPIGTGHAEHSCSASTGVLAAGVASTVIGVSSSTSEVVMGAYVRAGTVPVSIALRGVYGSLKAFRSFAEGLILWSVYGPMQHDGTAHFVVSGRKYLKSPVSLEDFVSIGIAAAGLKTGADVFEGLGAITDWVMFSSSLQEANNRLDRLQDSDLWDSYSANFSFQAPESGIYVIAVGVKVRSTAAIGAAKVFFLGQVDSITVGR